MDKIIKNSGRKASLGGDAEERIALGWIEQAGYQEVDGSPFVRRKFELAMAAGDDVADWCKKHHSGKRIFLHKHRTMKSIFGIPWRIDFTIWDEALWPRCLFIEIKSQSSSGSVDEKLPFVIQSLKAAGRPSGLLIRGSGFREAAREWGFLQQDETFRIWDNPSTMGRYIETGKSPRDVKSKASKPRVVDNQGALFS